MTPKDLLQSLKNSLDREAPTDITDVSMKIEYCDVLAKATVAKFIEGKWKLFEVFVRPIGASEDIEIGA